VEAPDVVALDEALALVVALAVGDGEPVFVGEPVDESVADSVGVALEERDALGVMPATEGSFTLMSEMVTTAKFEAGKGALFTTPMMSEYEAIDKMLSAPATLMAPVASLMAKALFTLPLRML
jgi:hypothetical protein